MKNYKKSRFNKKKTFRNLMWENKYSNFIQEKKGEDSKTQKNAVEHEEKLK